MVRKSEREPKDAIAYVRVRTKQQGRSGLGLEAQQENIAAFAKRERFNIIETTSRYKAPRATRSHDGPNCEPH